MALATVRRSQLSRYAWLCLGVLGVAVGVVSLAIARHDPDGSFAGGSVRDASLELAAGWSLMLAGLLFWARRPRNRCGPLLTAAGLAWFLPEWGNPGTRVSLAFTVGLIGFAACAPFVSHAALIYPSGRFRSLLERGTVAVAYVGAIGLLGILPAAVFDPAAQGCLQCPTNVALADRDAGAYDAFLRWGLRLGLVWAIALAVLIAWRLGRAGARLVVEGPVLAAAAAYLSLVAWDFQHSLARNVLSNDSFDLRLWRYEAITLVVFAAGVAWGLYRALQARFSVARLVVELGRSRQLRGARDALAQALGDPDLQVAYRRTGSDYVDAQGRPVDVGSGAGRAVTQLRRQGRPVAALIHDAALLRDPGLIEEVVDAARLAIENERFQAETRAQLESLRASRARIVEAGDAERRRLERDLHDGAQQRLVGLLLALRMLRTQIASEPNPSLDARLDEAETELRQALSELRELAHGIFPAILVDEGLAAAVETLVENSQAAIEVYALPDERFDPAVEAAAYFVIAETLKRTGATRAIIGASHTEGTLVVELESDGTPDEPLTDLEDRIGALGGRLAIRRNDGRLRLQTVLPCA